MLLLARQKEPLKQERRVSFPRLPAPPGGPVCPRSFSVLEIDDLNKAGWKQKLTLNKAYKRLWASGERGQMKGRNTSCAHVSERASKRDLALLPERSQ